MCVCHAGINEKIIIKDFDKIYCTILLSIHIPTTKQAMSFLFP